MTYEENRWIGGQRRRISSLKQENATKENSKTNFSRELTPQSSCPSSQERPKV